jgi:hypothetical protein
VPPVKSEEETEVLQPVMPAAERASVTVTTPSTPVTVPPPTLLLVELNVAGAGTEMVRAPLPTVKDAVVSPVVPLVGAANAGAARARAETPARASEVTRMRVVSFMVFFL